MFTDFQPPKTVTYEFKSLLPFHTGGAVSGKSDTFHPSGFLGSLRYFSSQIAKSLGFDDFEQFLWGDATGSDGKSKSVALSWTLDDYNTINLGNISFNSESSKGRSSWYFTGKDALPDNLDMMLKVTAIREIPDSYWQLLNLAIFLQTEYGSWGAKDQWGFGVLKLMSSDFRCDFSAIENAIISQNLQTNNKFYAGFYQFVIDGAAANALKNESEKVKVGLQLRYGVRNLFRESKRDDSLRHYLLGNIKPSNYGSAFQFSGAYSKGNDSWEQRTWLMLPHATNTNNLDSRFKEVFGTLEKEFNQPVSLQSSNLKLNLKKAFVFLPSMNAMEKFEQYQKMLGAVNG